MQVEGDIQATDGQSAVAVINRSVFGITLPMILGMYAVMIVMMFGGSYLLERLVPEPYGGGLVLPWIVVVGVGWWLSYRRWCAWRMRKGWAARGVNYPSATTYRLDDQALTIVHPMGEVRCLWAGVSEIARGSDFWVFVVPGLGYYLPRRFFADEGAERAFLRAALAKMSEAARGRSGKATAFVAWE